MNANGYSTIPSELYHWITFLTRALPPRSIRTFIELLIGAMLTGTGFVTDAYLAVNMTNHWNSYYKWLEHGKWSWLRLAQQLTRLVCSRHSADTVNLIIDDTLILRASKHAPGCKVHHQHGNKPNLAADVRGQCWVTLAMVMTRTDHSVVSIPLLSRLTPSVGNTGKLMAANTLIRAVYRVLADIKVRVLVDCWYMKRRFIQSMIGRGIEVIGQIRIDTRLYDVPPPRPSGQRGRPRKYGTKYTPEKIQTLKPTCTTLNLYGKHQPLRYRSKILKARFLHGQWVRAVWCEWLGNNNQYKPMRLLLSTDLNLTAEQIIQLYTKRWSIEPMFHQLKQAWGIRQAWQQSRQTLHRWVHLTSISYALVQLLSTLDATRIAPLCQHSPWRVKLAITAGQIRKGLRYHFRHVTVRHWYNPRCKKFEPPGPINTGLH